MATKLLVVVVYLFLCNFVSFHFSVCKEKTTSCITPFVSNGIVLMFTTRAKGSVHWLLAYTAFVVPGAQYITRSTAVSLCTGVGCIRHRN
jgi:hypothetical protein